MNIYWCYNEWENAGLYVIAKTRGRAKDRAKYDLDLDYLEVRSNLVRKNIGDEYEEELLEVGNPLLKKFDLHYYDEETGEEIPNE